MQTKFGIILKKCYNVDFIIYVSSNAKDVLYNINYLIHALKISKIRNFQFIRIWNQPILEFFQRETPAFAGVCVRLIS